MLDGNEEARMTNTLVGNAAQSPAPSSMKAWRVHEFGPPEAMIFETVPRPDPGPGEVLVKVTRQGSAPGTDRSGRAGVHCRNLFLSRWALICPVKSLLWVPAFPTWPSETRFSA
jgi:hypothetical protein